MSFADAATLGWFVWPAALLISAVVNMAITHTFSRGELALVALAGASAAAAFEAGAAPGAGPVAVGALIATHGLPGALLYVLPGETISATGVLALSVGWVLVATVLTALLDRRAVALHLDGRRQGLGAAVSLALKVPLAPATTAVGLAIVAAALVRAVWSSASHVGLCGGVLYSEWRRDGLGGGGVTLGCTVHVWSGRLGVILEHELYHSRQYIYLHDSLVPLWLLGGSWAWVVAAMRGERRGGCFSAARHDREEGNPLERAAYRLSGHSGC